DVWETLEQRASAEPVVPVPMSNEHVLECLAACFDPLDDLGSLLGRHWRVDQNRVALARNQCRGDVLKHLPFTVRRPVWVGKRYRIGYVHLVPQMIFVGHTQLLVFASILTRVARQPPTRL